TVIDRENCRQLGNLQHIAQALSQAGEADVGPSRARGRVNPDQRSQTATVDIGHVGKVQDQLPSVAQSLFQTCPQRICLFPEHDAPVTGDYRDALDQPFLDLEAHFVPPKRPQARACEKINMIAPQCKADEASPDHGFSEGEPPAGAACHRWTINTASRPETTRGIARLVYRGAAHARRIKFDGRNSRASISPHDASQGQQTTTTPSAKPVRASRLRVHGSFPAPARRKTAGNKRT